MSEWIKKIWAFAQRLLFGVGGQIGVSGANFLLSLILVNKVTPDEFGTFSFIQILVFLGFGLSNALLSAPLMADLHRHDKPIELTVNSFFLANLALGAAMFVGIFCVTEFAFHQSWITSLLFGVSSVFLFVGRMARSYLLDHEKAVRVLVSDYTYALVIVFGCGFAYLSHAINIGSAVMLLSLASVLSFLVMGKEILAFQMRGLIHGKWQPFMEAFRQHGRHALTGVLTTEATSRAHSYIVTFWMGPAAFAPLAAGILFFRPILMVILSLTQFERARLARLLRNAQNKEAWAALKFFYVALGFVWVMNVALILVVMVFFYDHVLGEKYAYNDMVIALTFYGVITLLTCLRGPASALLQANADFQSLSKTTIISCLATIPVVTFCVWQFGAIWSLAGVLVGEGIAAILVFRLAREKIPKS